ncbi:MAG: galactokinase, partial [Oscillospiraceae bacterium]|nr:galactokinase [Oscillospiraceae bacterium]
CGDRAVMRAMHVFSENKRVEEEKKAIESGNVSRFLELVRESGLSSWRFLQNIDTYKEPRHQEVAFALGLAEKLLGGRGAVRVHGGGFAGTIQAFVPKDDADRFVFEMERVLGKGTCSIMQVGCPGAGIIE